MRRAHRLTSGLAPALVCIGALALATAASAQTAGETRGLRYLSWTGRTEAAAPAAPAPTATTRRDLRRPNMVIPHGGFAAVETAPRPETATAPAAPRTALTPANAWMRPPAPVPAPVVAAAPQPAPQSASQPRATPEYLPDQGGRGQSAPVEAVYSPPAAPPAPAEGPVDPMAPRRDAPIFRMQRDAPAPQPTAARAEAPPAAAGPVEAPPRATRVVEVTNSGERPPQQGARYYSVHRQVGRQPDALEIPEPGYVDGLAIGQIETLASQDLAVPEQGPALIRDANGRMRAQPAASDGDHQ